MDQKNTYCDLCKELMYEGLPGVENSYKVHKLSGFEFIKLNNVEIKVGLKLTKPGYDDQGTVDTPIYEVLCTKCFKDIIKKLK